MNWTNRLEKNRSIHNSPHWRGRPGRTHKTHATGARMSSTAISLTRTNMNNPRKTAIKPYNRASPSRAKAVPRLALDVSGNGSAGATAVHSALLRSMNHAPHCKLECAAMYAMTTRGTISPAAGYDSGELGPRIDQDPHNHQ